MQDFWRRLSMASFVIATLTLPPAPAADLPFRNASLPINTRVADLVISSRA
jgi:hypothetical protein